MWFSSFSKVPYVVTLNLYLKMPDKMQKTRNWLMDCGLRKRQKTVKEIWPILRMPFENDVLDFFLSPQCTNHFLVFCILSGISRYKFRSPTWGTLEKLENHIFSHIPYFYVLWARWLWKFQSWALLFWYSCMFRNLIQ